MAWIRACGGGSPAVPDGKTVTPINDVTIWQKCAGIANPTYTTLADVLADISILSTLMASDNAVDYLVRSTTFASDVCADANAMTYIGQSNYASDTLLDDSTWCTAICNSSYYSNVLNVSVPQMTSNTTPSGVASSNSEYSSYKAWLAFNRRTGVSQGYISNNVSSNVYVKYAFTNAKKIYKVVLTNGAEHQNPKTCKIEYSLDNSTWVTLDTFTGINSHNAVTTRIVNSTVAAMYWRLYVVDCYNSGYIEIGELGFYGREDV